MAVEFRDYYAVLGLTRDATAAEIRKAYRSLARTHHPDVAKDPTTAEARFKELNEANEVLSDPESRRKYDELGEHWRHPERQPAPNGHAPWDDDEAGAYHFEGTGFSDFYEYLFGTRARAPGGFATGRGERTSRAAPAPRGQDAEGDIMVTLDEVMRGATRTITLQRSDARGTATSTQTLRVHLPVGVREGQLVRLAGKGHESADGGEAGHLYLRVKFATHPDFRVRGADLYGDLDLAPWEAVLGAQIRMPTLDGAVSIRVAPGTPAGRTLRLRGRGLPRGDGSRGDLFVVIAIQVPASVTAEQEALWKQLAGLSAFDPRSTR